MLVDVRSVVCGLCSVLCGLRLALYGVVHVALCSILRLGFIFDMCVVFYFGMILGHPRTPKESRTPGASMMSGHARLPKESRMRLSVTMVFPGFLVRPYNTHRLRPLRWPQCGPLGARSLLIL